MSVRIRVGTNLSRLRRDRQLTQEQLAELSGLSQQFISNLERGKQNATIDTLDALAHALRIDVSLLLSPT